MFCSSPQRMSDITVENKLTVNIVKVICVKTYKQERLQYLVGKGWWLLDPVVHLKAIHVWHVIQTENRIIKQYNMEANTVACNRLWTNMTSGQP